MLGRKTEGMKHGPDAGPGTHEVPYLRVPGGAGGVMALGWQDPNSQRVN